MLPEERATDSIWERAGRAVIESESRFRSLVEAASDWVWEIDRNGRYIFASSRIQDLLGYAPEEVLGKTPFDLMPPSEAARVSALFADVVAEPHPFSHLVNVNLHRDGHEVILESCGTPFFDENGDLAGYRGFDRDITARVRDEEDLRRSRIQLSEAMKLAHVVCWQADPVSDTLEVDDAFLALHGTTFDREGGYRIGREDYVQRFLHPEDRPRFYEVLKQCAQPGATDCVIAYENRIVRGDGTARHLMTRIRVLKDPDGTILRAYGTAQDITEQKEAEAEQERLLAVLRTALAEVKTLSGLLPICSSCKKIRNQAGEWEQMEVYIRDRSGADFSHGICPECAKRLFPDL